MADEAGTSRDKLSGLLWPESDHDRARHSLTQALYLAKRALQSDDLFVTTGNDIRIDASLLSSDVADFQTLVREGDAEEALALYKGPFLDGFYLSGSAEFEHWASSQRDRLHALAGAALERLADQAEAAGELGQSLEWVRRLVILQPLDARWAARLMRAMAIAGDRAGAIQHARVHAALLRQELDLGPDPAVEALAESLRSDVSRTPGPMVADVRRDAEVERATPALPDPAARYAPLGAGGSTPSTALARRDGGAHLVRRPRWQVAAAVGLLAVFAVAAVARVATRDTSSGVAKLAVRQRVVVAPFRVSGADASLAYLQQGIVELLSTRLADDTAARSVDAGAVLGAWRTAGLATTGEVPHASVVALANRLGAERVVVGSVVGSPSRAVITATVLLVPGGAVRAEASVAGPADSITTLLDRLAARLLVAEAGQEASLARHTSRSLSAVRAFLSGQSAFRTGDVSSALQHYDDALARDSAFALAGLYKAFAADRLGLPGAVRAGVRAAWRARDELNAGDAALLLAIGGPRYPAPSTMREVVAAWRQPLALAPRSADAAYLLGARLLKEGAAAGLSDAHTQALAALTRALEIDSAHVAARQLAASIGIRTPGAAAAGRGDAGAGDPGDPLGPSTRWRAALARGDTAALHTLRSGFRRLGPANLRLIALAGQHDAAGIADSRTALAELRSRSPSLLSRADLALGEHSLAMITGRRADALAAGARLRAARPASNAWLRLRVLDALHGDVDTAGADSAARRLAASVGSTTPAMSEAWDLWEADACVVAQWHLAREDTLGVARTIALLADRDDNPAMLVSAAPRACAVLLDAWLGIVTGARDARDRLRRADSLVYTSPVAGDAATWAPAVLARLHERGGDLPAAQRAIRRGTSLLEWPRYLASALYHEGRLAVRAGDAAYARAAYQRFLGFRPATDARAAELQRMIAAMPPGSPPAPQPHAP